MKDMCAWPSAARSAPLSVAQRGAWGMGHGAYAPCMGQGAQPGRRLSWPRPRPRLRPRQMSA